MRWKFSCPARFSAIHSRANSPDWISARICFIASRVSSVTMRGPRVMSPYSAVLEIECRMPADALLVHEVDDQLELVQDLEVRHARVVAGLDQRVEARAHELGRAAAQHGLLAEQVRLGLVA